MKYLICYSLSLFWIGHFIFTCHARWWWHAQAISLHGFQLAILYAYYLKIVHNPCGTDHKVFDNLLFLKCIFHCMITLKEVSHLNLILKKFLLFIIMRSIQDIQKIICVRWCWFWYQLWSATTEDKPWWEGCQTC